MAAGKPYNEADWAADSTMTAILGRMATYSGKVVKWDEAIKSALDLSPKSFAWDAETPVKPRADGTLRLRRARRDEGVVNIRPPVRSPR